MCTHFLFLAGALWTWKGIRKLEHLRAAMEEWTRGTVSVLVHEANVAASADSVEFQDPTSDMQQHERLATYHANAMKWLQTGPTQRLWILKKVCHAQASAQKMTLDHAGPRWYRQHIDAHRKGQERLYKPLETSAAHTHGHFSRVSASC